MNNIYNSIAKCRYNADEKIVVVSLSNTVIKPHTMMIEIINTSITSTTMFTISIAVAIAVLAKQYFIIFWRKNYLFIKS